MKRGSPQQKHIKCLPKQHQHCQKQPNILLHRAPTQTILSKTFNYNKNISSLSVLFSLPFFQKTKPPSAQGKRPEKTPYGFDLRQKSLEQVAEIPGELPSQALGLLDVSRVYFCPKIIMFGWFSHGFVGFQVFILFYFQ